MRILVVPDLHYRLPHYDWLVAASGDVDAVAIVGDLADVVSVVPHEVQTVVLTNYLGLLAERTAVFAASGNHDLDGPGAHGEQVAALDRPERRVWLYHAPPAGTSLCHDEAETATWFGVFESETVSLA